MFVWEMRSKLPELRREAAEVSREETHYKHWSNKLKGKAYADDKRGAVPKSIRVAEESNKLSSNFHPRPFKVVQKTKNEVTARNDVGVESSAVQRLSRTTMSRRVRPWPVMAVVQLFVRETNRNQNQHQQK